MTSFVYFNIIITYIDIRFNQEGIYEHKSSTSSVFISFTLIPPKIEVKNWNVNVRLKKV